MNKGFTLVELLAVIIVILSLALLTTISVSNIIKNSKQRLNDAQKQIIEDATGMWIADNLDKIPDAGDEYNCVYITFEELKDYGSIDDITLKDSDEDIDDMIIKIELKNNIKYDITVDAQSVQNCNKVY